MTLNQKIFAIGSLSVLILVLFIAGGVVLKRMVDKGGIINSGSPDPAQVSSEQETVPEVQGEEAVDGNGDTVEESASKDTKPAEEPIDENIGWQTYRNNFYTIDYPANYKTAGQNEASGNLNFEIKGFGAEAVIFIASGKKTLAFQGTWAVISREEATGHKLLDTETVDMNGVRFEKSFWAIRQIDNGAWLTAIVYYGCSQEGDCFSLMRGVTAKGIVAWPETTGAQISDKTKIKTLVNLIKASKETDTVNFNNMFLTFRFNEKIAAAVPADSASRQTQWKEYVFEPLVGSSSSDATDRRLVGIKDDGTKDVITESVKTVMGWNSLFGFYPNKVLFPPYAKEIYFTKYLSDSGSSSGMYALDVTTLKYRRLVNVGKIYENYLNYFSIISPDKKLIASLGSSDLYILDLAADKATVVATAAEGEILNPAGPGPEYKWLDSNTVQYPVYKNQDFGKPVEIRKASAVK